MSIEELLSSDEEKLVQLGFKRADRNYSIEIKNRLFNSINLDFEERSGRKDIILKNNKPKELHKVMELISNIYSFFYETIDFDEEDLDRQSTGGKTSDNNTTDINRHLENEKYCIDIHIYVFELGLRISLSDKNKKLTSN